MTATVAKAFDRAAVRWPGRTFLNVLDETAQAYGISPGPVAYGEMAKTVSRLRRAYLDADIGSGDRVALLLENRPAILAHFFALNGLGASIVPLNPDLRRTELEHIFGHAEPVLAVSTKGRVADLRDASGAVGVCSVVEEDDEFPRCGTGADAATGQEDEAALLYTSGTTAKAKGCVLSNGYFIEAGRWYAAAGGLCALDDGERMLTPLPLFHMNALAFSVMATVEVGGTLTVLDRFHPRTWWQSVRDSGATAIHYLGVMPAILMKAPPSAGDREHQIRFGFGANVEPNLHAPFEARFGFPLVEAWAMTETGAGACIAANRQPRRVGAKSIGRPGEELDVRIAGDDGSPVGDGPGELLVRRRGGDPRFGFFSRYHKDPGATEAAWRGGWFHTGDMVRREGQDLLFVDRAKNVIRRSGENIAAVEVEAVLVAQDGVRAVAVAPVEDALRGEEVCALVVAERADAAFAAELVGHVLSEMAYYKAPGHVVFVDALPLTATQKVDRRALRAMAAASLRDGIAHDTRSLKGRSR